MLLFDIPALRFDNTFIQQTRNIDTGLLLSCVTMLKLKRFMKICNNFPKIIVLFYDIRV